MASQICLSSTLSRALNGTAAQTQIKKQQVEKQVKYKQILPCVYTHLATYCDA
jgi:hypothetical protein